ncbi:MAG: Lrp/AsnC family transcriptional regulator [Nitrososphaeraceae archaeon]
MSRKPKMRSYIPYTPNNNDDGGARGIDNNKDNKTELVLLDSLNAKIIKELVSNPNVRSVTIASKYKAPLSTVQRRKARLENSILKKNYQINTRELGWRIADLFLSVEKGRSEELAKKILDSNGNNNIILNTSLRIGNPEINVSAQVLYKGSEELLEIIESVKAIPYVKNVDWSETVKVVGNNNIGMLERLFNT